MDNVRSIDRLWTVNDVSNYLGVPVNTVRGWRCKSYGPPARRIGKHLRYDPAEVRTWFDGLTADVA